MRFLREFPIQNMPRLTHIGQAIDQESETVGSHRHLGYEVVYFAAGSAEVELDRRTRLRTKPGDLLIVAPEVEHRFNLSSKRASFYWLGFQAGELVRRAPVSALPARTGRFRSAGLKIEKLGPAAAGPGLDGLPRLDVETHALLPGFFRAGRIFRDLLEEIDAQDEQRDTLAALLVLQLFVRISRGAAHRNKAPDARADTPEEGRDALIDRLEQFIHAQAGSDLSLRRLAAFAGYNASYLSRFYHARTGGTLSDFIRGARLERAKKLLAGGSSVTEAAALSGFKSIHHFSAAFKRAEGLAPTRYRSGAREELDA